ncbi:MAG: hypothetical protein JWN55_1062 [Frankiales bacterium]|nr:hypothetical protein [Frankiales bacterium]
MKIRRTCVAAVLVVGSGLTSSATAGPGQLPVGQGGRASANVRLLANVPTGTGTGGAFLGTTYFQTSADTVWFSALSTQAVTGGLLAFDASRPEQPVPVGSLPIPHHENEDLTLSARRKLAVISQQPYRANPLSTASPFLPGRQFLVDVAVPSALRLVSVVETPATVGTRADGRTLAGPGHTTTLVGGDRYLWVSGARNGGIYVIDIADPAAPKALGYFLSPAGRAYGAFTPGVVHDVDVDRYGDVWLTGSGGTAVYRLSTNPLKPTLVASIWPSDNARAQQLLHHGSQRLDRDHVVITEEDYEAGCDSADHQDGSLQVWRIDRAAKRLLEVGSYDAPKGADASGPLSSLCSSHWFTVNGAKVVADAWYGAGVRFLDVSNPRKPRPIGLWAGDSTIASQARFVPGRDDLVYVADYLRGLDVVQIDRGGRGARTLTAADEKRVVGGPGRAVPGLTFPVQLHPHEDFGWVCAVPSRAQSNRNA